VVLCKIAVTQSFTMKWQVTSGKCGMESRMRNEE